MTIQKTFDNLLLIARPAAGKSEIIDFLKGIPLTERVKRYHIAEFEEIDDFPMIWTWFEEDAILSSLGHPRLHSNEDGYFLETHFWDLLIRKINLEYKKKLRDHHDYHAEKTVILEFARGTEHGGFTQAFKHLSPEIASRLAILYIQVSWDESLRKNQARFNPDRPDSILEHGLSDEKLTRIYRWVDWDLVSTQDPYYIPIQGFKVPYFVFENEDDVTSQRGPALSSRLETSLQALWDLYKDQHPDD